MQATNWKKRNSLCSIPITLKTHLERFFLSQRLEDHQSIFVLLLLNHSADSESGIIPILFAAITMMTFEDDLQKSAYWELY